MEEWDFSVTGDDVSIAKLNGHVGELETASHSIEISESAITIDMGSENIVFNILEITEDYLTYVNPYENQLLNIGRLYFDQAEAQEYYTLSEDWLEGNTLYLISYLEDYGSVGIIYEYFDNYANNYYLDNGTFIQSSTFEVNTNGDLLYNGGNDGIAVNSIACANEEFVAFNTYHDGVYQLTSLYFYEEEEAIEYAEALTEPINLVCDLIVTSPILEIDPIIIL